MPIIMDVPPQSIQNDLENLKNALDNEIPAKQENQNLLIATWNIRSFSNVSRVWTATGNTSPKRDLRALRAISEIVSRFDVIAIQEVDGNLRALRDMLKYLGNAWGFLMTDVTLGDAGNKERLAFVYDSTRLKPSGLACELVIPPEELDNIGPNALNEQFARTPYAVSFKAGNTTFILVTLHVLYGEQEADRIPELTAIAEWMYKWARRSNRFGQNLITLGDFNIDRHEDELWQAFTSTGLYVPPDLNDVRRSIFADNDNPMLEKFYDQIAWFKRGSGRQSINMRYINGGGFDFLPYVYTNTTLSRRSISYRMSDHFPLWVEFSI